MRFQSHFRPRGAVAMLLVLLLGSCSREAEPRRDTHSDSHAHGSAEPARAETAKSEEQGAGKLCTEHNVPLAECGICKPQLLPGLKPGEGLKVRLASADSASIAGVETALPRTGSISDAVECYAELAFNQNKLAHIAAPVGGIVQEVAVDAGTTVEERQLLTQIWSATIAEAVAKAVLSHQTLEREQKLRNERVTPQKDLQQAEAEHRAACQQLRTLGFTEEQIDELQNKPQEQVMIEVRAPFAGDIVERTAVRGALVEPGKTLFTVADLSTMWAMLNIPEAALARVKVGQTIELRVESFPERTFTGKLTWIAAEVDEKSRMVRARAELQNPDRLLKARMFARARILTRTSPNALLLPSDALQHSAGKAFVFVQLEPDLFEARVVSLGASLNSQVEINNGLKAGEKVVVAHGFPLKSALLISRLGAGCVDD